MSVTQFNEFSLDDLKSEQVKKIQSFLNISDQATIFHTPIWNIILSESFFKKNEKYKIILAEKDDKILGIYPFMLKKRFSFLKYNYSLPGKYDTPYGGPIYNSDKAILLGLIKKANTGLLTNLRIKTLPGDKIDDFPDIFDKECAETSVINLEKSEEQIWNEFNRNTKRNIKKADANKLKIFDLETYDSENVDIYYNFIRSTLGDKSVKINPKEFYHKVIKYLLPKKLARFVFVQHNNQFIGGAIYLIFKDTVYFWHVGVLREYMNLAPNFHLVWDMIRWSKKKGYRKFDLVCMDREKLPGIARFKLGWRGKTEKYHLLNTYSIIHKFLRKNK